MSDWQRDANHAHRRAARSFQCHVVGQQAVEPAEREVVAEQPLRIIVNGQSVATLMQTPGAEIELATGWLLSEGLIGSRNQITAMSFQFEGSPSAAGVVRVRLTEELSQAAKRYQATFSSCSLCGLEKIETLAEGLPPFAKPAARLGVEDIFRLRDAMEVAQPMFRRTGGTHAAALAELPVEPAAQRLVVREDIGRHNALDKAIGAAAAMAIAPQRSLLILSGRLSVEMVAKAARAGISDLAGVSAPSALGIELARKLNMFLAGFLRGHTMTAYSGVEAIAAGLGH